MALKHPVHNGLRRDIFWHPRRGMELGVPHALGTNSLAHNDTFFDHHMRTVCNNIAIHGHREQEVAALGCDHMGHSSMGAVYGDAGRNHMPDLSLFKADAGECV